MQIFGFLGYVLGYVLWAAFYVFQNFGLAIIVFTLVIKLILFPFTVKQQKSMAGTARLQKKQRELQEKYANNRQKLQEETSKLYEKEGVKPMGGCLTTLVPMLVILGIFYAVAYPLTNTFHFDADKVTKAIEYVNTIPGYVSSTNPTYQQIALLKVFPNIANTTQITALFNADQISTITHFANGFGLFGLDLLAIPNEYGIFSVYILFPLFCFLSNVGSQLIMTRINSNQMAQQQGCMKAMLYLLPLFSAYIAYSVPAAVAFYWIISALISLVQSIAISKVFSPVILNANAEARHTALMFENEAKVPYVYVPREHSSDLNEGSGKNNLKNNVKKKKKK